MRRTCPDPRVVRDSKRAEIPIHDCAHVSDAFIITRLSRKACNLSYSVFTLAILLFLLPLFYVARLRIV